jgi:hypothetical protein
MESVVVVDVGRCQCRRLGQAQNCHNQRWRRRRQLGRGNWPQPAQPQNVLNLGVGWDEF